MNISPLINYSTLRQLVFVVAAFAAPAQAIANVATPAQTATQLTDWVTTGIAEHDTRSYWNCSIGTEEAIDNLHVRFWKNGNGHSGHHPVKWQAETNSQLTLSAGSNPFSLTNISFIKENAEPNELHASDTNGAPVRCQWSGPIRGSSNADILFDEGLNLLEHQLTGSSGTRWSCTVSNENEQTRSVVLHFNQHGVGIKNNTDNFLWYVDDRYNVIMSFQDDFQVFSEIKFTSSEQPDDTFSALKFSDSINCVNSTL